MYHKAVTLPMKNGRKLSCIANVIHTRAFARPNFTKLCASIVKDGFVGSAPAFRSVLLQKCYDVYKGLCETPATYCMTRVVGHLLLLETDTSTANTMPSTSKTLMPEIKDTNLILTGFTKEQTGDEREKSGGHPSIHLGIWMDTLNIELEQFVQLSRTNVSEERCQVLVETEKRPVYRRTFSPKLRSAKIIYDTGKHHSIHSCKYYLWRIYDFQQHRIKYFGLGICMCSSIYYYSHKRWATVVDEELGGGDIVAGAPQAHIDKAVDRYNSRTDDYGVVRGITRSMGREAWAYGWTRNHLAKSR
ncbi:Hypothetical protein CINCED_3A023659 [Cinara cedri]|uniref:Uncharacterized protein n=1 Tax=Cinara cedri TaxID=506608 RepID=A0A5E4N4M5_9HEMI|nr:Hypothetical protein CINCED_3A023659 [Cinara cedri]